MDPLANKYPSVSPFNYALNNPMRYIDPNGSRVVCRIDSAGNKTYELIPDNDAVYVAYDAEGNEIYRRKFTITGDKEDAEFFQAWYDWAGQVTDGNSEFLANVFFADHSAAQDAMLYTAWGVVGGLYAGAGLAYAPELGALANAALSKGSAAVSSVSNTILNASQASYAYVSSKLVYYGYQLSEQALPYVAYYLQNAQTVNKVVDAVANTFPGTPYSNKNDLETFLNLIYIRAAIEKLGKK